MWTATLLTVEYDDASGRGHIEILFSNGTAKVVKSVWIDSVQSDTWLSELVTLECTKLNGLHPYLNTLKKAVGTTIAAIVPETP